MPEPLLLDRFMPRYDHSVVLPQVFRALPEKCFEALVNMDILEIPVIRLLIRARGLPHRIEDAVRGRGAEAKVVRGLDVSGSVTLASLDGSSSTRGLAQPSDSSVSRGNPWPACRLSRSLWNGSPDSTKRASPRSPRAPASTRTASGSRS